MGWKTALFALGFILCLPIIVLSAEEEASDSKEIVLSLFHPKPARWQSAQITMTPRGCETPAILTMSLTEDRRRFAKFELRTESMRLAVPTGELKNYLFPFLEHAGIRAWCPDQKGNQPGGYLISFGYTSDDDEYDGEDDGVLLVVIDMSGEVTINRARDVDTFFDKNDNYRTLRPARWQAASIVMTPRGCERNVRLDAGLSANRRRFTGLSLTTPSGHFTTPLGELKDFAYPILEDMSLVGWCDDPEDKREEGYEVSIPYSLARIEYALEEEMSEVSATFGVSGNIDICDDYDFLPCWEDEED